LGHSTFYREQALGLIGRDSLGSQLFIGLILNTRADQKTSPILGLLWGTFIDLVGIFNFYRFNSGQFYRFNMGRSTGLMWAARKN